MHVTTTRPDTVPPASRNRLWRAPIAGLCIAAATACGGSAGDPAAANPGNRANAGNGAAQESIAVKVAPVGLESIASLYSTSATLRADRRATVIARTRGVIRRLAVEEGDMVSEGQPLAFLEDDEQRITADRARATRDTARSEAKRLVDLNDQGLVSDDEFDKSQRDATDAEHALQLAELELSRTVIRAPFAGVILQRHLDVGATVADGTAVYDLADLQPLYADINIPERHVTRLQPGQRVRLTADSTGESVDAAIERIAPMVDPATGTVKVTVAVEGSSDLRPGAFVRVDIVTDAHLEALVVARSALVAEGRRWLLYRLAAGDDDTVEQVEVRIGFENGDRVEVAEVLGDEVTLDAGDPVVVTGASALSDGATVTVVEEGAEAEAPEGEAGDAA